VIYQITCGRENMSRTNISDYFWERSYYILDDRKHVIYQIISGKDHVTYQITEPMSRTNILDYRNYVIYLTCDILNYRNNVSHQITSGRDHVTCRIIEVMCHIRLLLGEIMWPIYRSYVIHQITEII